MFLRLDSKAFCANEIPSASLYVFVIYSSFSPAINLNKAGEL